MERKNGKERKGKEMKTKLFLQKVRGKENGEKKMERKKKVKK